MLSQAIGLSMNHGPMLDQQFYDLFGMWHPDQEWIGTTNLLDGGSRSKGFILIIRI